MILPVFAVMLVNIASSQSRNSLALADQYFEAGEYLTAAGLYEQYLNPVVKEKGNTDFPLNIKKNRAATTGHYTNRLDIVYKQAESYRMARNWMQALALYQQCYEKDPAAYVEALYWAALCQRQLGDLVSAEAGIDRFLKEAPANDALVPFAKKERSMIEFIRVQQARPDSILFRVGKLDNAFADRGVFAPAAAGDHFVVTSTVMDSAVAEGTNPNHNRLFTARLVNGRLEHFEPLLIQGIDPSFNQGAASLSADGNTLYFTQWNKENGVMVSSIYYAKKSKNGWARPVMLTSIKKPGANSKQPFCSPDGKYLFFSTDRKGGLGGYDIWYAPLKADGSTGEAVNAGTAVNSTGNEQAPFYHVHSGSLVFASDRMPGMGGLDLFVAKGEGASFQAAENMGAPVNSAGDDAYFFAAEGKGLLEQAIVSSDRGSECCLATYTVSKSPKKKFITGLIRDCVDNAPMAEAEVIIKNNEGMVKSMVTGADGTYSFEISGDASQYFLVVNKESYNPKEAGVQVESVDESGMLEDRIANTALCIEKRIVLKVENVVSVYFDFDRYQLKPRAMQQLDSIYTILETEVTASLQISGYTDGLGSVEYNQILSDKRARACAEYLLGKGLDQSRISFESFGACCPVEMEAINGRDNPDGRAMNRRALLHIVREHLSNVTHPQK